MEEKFHKIDFSVPLSGSLLFDIHVVKITEDLCERFPELHYEKSDKMMHLFGYLNDKAFKEWNAALTTGTIHLP